jgi:hypothetical protein
MGVVSYVSSDNQSLRLGQSAAGERDDERSNLALPLK